MTESELDLWFPRPPAKPEPQPQPEHGVIEGARGRERKRRYGRRWYQIRRAEQDGDAEKGAEER